MWEVIHLGKGKILLFMLFAVQYGPQVTSGRSEQYHDMIYAITRLVSMTFMLSDSPLDTFN